MLETTVNEDKTKDPSHMAINEKNELTMTEMEKGQTLQYLLKFMS